MEKELFDINWVMEQVAEAVRPFPKAAMFELAQKGHDSPFEQLVGCILSIRTYDEVSLPVSLNLFARARTPAQIAALDIAELTKIIRRSSFSERKAAQIKAIAQQLVDEFEGKLPCDRDLILSFKGVGPKCANLALGIACGQKFISVDIHVHRITNRWGYVAAKTPEKTMAALQNKLPEKYWIDINRLLVPFGKHICTASRPRCTSCPLAQMCSRIGVASYR
ncbi:endonuclease III domain-containing protein [Candidatus Leptofilum sp.]|uniref:endonuclease III domain-containing protein n=1 Tax=Candidatus Leptofilum sp. TaxID=3241576 RepID=UPI003B5BAAF7